MVKTLILLLALGSAQVFAQDGSLPEQKTAPKDKDKWEHITCYDTLRPRDFVWDDSLYNKITYLASIPLTWAKQMGHNGIGLFSVLDFMAFRPLPKGLLEKDHPWVTGKIPETGEYIWPKNIIFSSTRPENDPYPNSDEYIASSVGRHLASMVNGSATADNILGKRPPAVDYIHGSVHYNGAVALFNDPKDAIKHFTDPNFMKEMMRFIYAENREVTILFRDKETNLDELAFFTTFMRSTHHWFGNPQSNTAKGLRLWGAHSNFPGMNWINGSWIDDLKQIRNDGNADQVVRPPIETKNYFQEGPYNQGSRDDTLLPERLLAYGTSWRILLKRYWNQLWEGKDPNNIFFINSHREKFKEQQKQNLQDHEKTE